MKRFFIYSLLLLNLLVWNVFAFLRFDSYRNVFQPVHTMTQPLELTFFDLGVGDACLMTTPTGKHVLIDNGDAHAAVVLPYLRKHNIYMLDAIIITSPHPEHVSGIVRILSTMPVSEVIDGARGTSPMYAVVRSCLYAHPEITYSKLSSGEAVYVDPFLECTALYPVPSVTGTSTSLLLRITYNAVSVLFTSDLESSEEARFLPYGSALESTILKYPNHGVGKEMSSSLLSLIQPRVIVISGKTKSAFGMINAYIWDIAYRFKSMIYATDIDGIITITTNGTTITN